MEKVRGVRGFLDDSGLAGVLFTAPNLVAWVTGGLERAVGAVDGGMSERELAADIARRLELAAIVPCVLLVGSDERRRRFRHPTVSDATGDRDVLAVIVAVRGGLDVALTRSASIGTTDAELARRHRAACEVDARMIAATAPGATNGQALQAGVEACASLGYPEEWRHHYQGGPIGYGTREFGPTPLQRPNALTHHPIAVGHACAWNPTVQGAKSEEAFIVGEGGPELVTCSGRWPVLEIDVGGGIVVTRPAVLER